MLFPIKQLLENKGKPVAVTLDTTVEEALDLMIEYDFSQLPIIDSQGRLAGLISEQSITRTFYHLGGDKLILKLKVADCKRSVPYLSTDADIFVALDSLKTASAVIVVENDRPVGILTDYDATNFFRDYSEAIIILQDIELTLRQFIRSAFSSDQELNEVLLQCFPPDRSGPNARVKEIHDLTLSEYRTFVNNKNVFPRFNGAFDPKDLFNKLMDPVIKVRNQIMHFRGQSSRTQLDAIKTAKEWFQNRPLINSGHLLEIPLARIGSLPSPAQSRLREIPVMESRVAPAIQPEILLSKEVEHFKPIIDFATPASFAIEDDFPLEIELAPLEKAMPEPTKSLTLPALRDTDTGPSFDDEDHKPLVTIEDKTLQKYSDFQKWLIEQAKLNNEIRVSFKTLNSLIPGGLPQSAFQHRSWWSNDNSSQIQAQAWLKAGWEVTGVDFNAEEVTFRRLADFIKQDFFKSLLEELKQRRPGITNAKKTQAQGWFDFSAGRSGFKFAWVFGIDFLRVELYIDTGNKEKNKSLFKFFQEDKDETEFLIGAQLNWEEMPNKQASRISYAIPARITDPPERLAELKEWAVITMIKFADTFRPIIQELTLS